MEEQEEHEKKADEFERGADALEEQGHEADREIEDVKSDWESKVSDEQIPGAMGEGDSAPGGAQAFDEDENDDEDSGEAA